MEYKQNIHILLPIEKFEALRELGHITNLSRSELVRLGINMLLKKYKKKKQRKKRKRKRF